VRKAAAPLLAVPADYYLVLAGDHICRVDYRAFIDRHKERGADITIAAQPIDPVAASSMGIFVFDRDGHIVAFEEKPKGGSSGPRSAAACLTAPRSTPHSDERPFMASMGIYVFRGRCCWTC